MYIIDSSLEIPDIEYMRRRAEQLMDEGIAVRDLSKLYIKIHSSQQAAANNLRELYGIENPNSSQQILGYLQNVLNDDIVEACCRDGNWTTDKNAMIELAMKGYQEAIDIMTYRKAKKYAESIKSVMDKVCRDGRIHPEVVLGKTNRVNYREPALMNIPKGLLWYIITPRVEGNILISVDIKNQEPWIMINMLKIEILKEILEEAGEGLYEAVFHKIFDRPCTELERKELKVSWNAMTYGATKFGLKQICRHADGDKIYEFFSKIPEFKAYSGRSYGLAKKNVQELKTYFGTVVRANEYGPKLRRVLMDIPIQGTGSDILALLMKHFDEEMEYRGLDDVLTLNFTRHDELIVEVDREYAEEVGLDEVKNTLADVLEHKVDDWEPFQVKISEIEVGDISKILDTDSDDDE